MVTRLQKRQLGAAQNSAQASGRAPNAASRQRDLHYEHSIGLQNSEKLRQLHMGIGKVIECVQHSDDVKRGFTQLRAVNVPTMDFNPTFGRFCSFQGGEFHAPRLPVWIAEEAVEKESGRAP